MLKGKVAIVTGSTSGIGLGIATSLAAQGADVMLNGFGDPGAIEQTRRQLQVQHGIMAGYSPADMSKPAEVRELVAKTRADLGPVVDLFACTLPILGAWCDLLPIGWRLPSSPSTKPARGSARSIGRRNR